MTTFYGAKFMNENQAIGFVNGASVDVYGALFDGNENTLVYAGASPVLLVNSGSTAKAVSRLYIKNTNLKTFTIQVYEAVPPTTTNFTPTISVTDNTSKNLYFEFASINIPATDGAIKITYSSTIDGGAMYMGEFYLGNESLDLSLFSGQVVVGASDSQAKILQLSDNTFSKVFIRDTQTYDLDLVNISASNINSLKTLYDQNKTQALIFLPFPSSPDWNGTGGRVNWVSPWNFYNFSRNVNENGYDGVIQLAEASGNA